MSEDVQVPLGGGVLPVGRKEEMGGAECKHPSSDTAVGNVATGYFPFGFAGRGMLISSHHVSRLPSVCGAQQFQ